MTNEEFANLVKQLEGQARNQPKSYRRKVLLLAVLGNIYLSLALVLIGGLFAVSLASVVFLKVLAIKIILPLGVFLWAVLKSLWVKVPTPQGKHLEHKDAPALFDLIESLRLRARAPRFHQVLITQELNAGVVQRPRLGIFGWYHNHLLIGLPLTKMLTVDQFAAVLAHEFGHLAKGHGRLSNWIYRQRRRWIQLMGLFGDSRMKRGGFLFKPFLNRFAPYFNAYSFPLARAHEYEADAASVRATSSAIAAEALTAVHVVGSYLSQQYWPQIYRHADETPQPAFAPYHEMRADLPRAVPPDTISQWIEQAMQEQTGLGDTHPCLKDRLSALGETPRYAPPEAGQSAEKLLGASLAHLTAQFDESWIASTMESWRQRYEQVRKGRDQLAKLEQKIANGEELTLREAYDRAQYTEEFRADGDAALAQFEALQQKAPQDPILCYALGVRWLKRNDEHGIALVQYAMENDANAYLPGAETLRDYYWRTGNRDEAHRWHAQMLERAETDRLAKEERANIQLQSKYARHGLDEPTIAAMRAKLKTIRNLRKAYLVRKQVRFYPERPLYVLGFTVRGVWLGAKRRRAEVQKQVLNEVNFPGQTLVFSVEGSNYRFGRKFRWMRGSRIL